MKKLLIFLSLLVYSSLAGAPPVKRDAIILKSEGIKPYERIWRATIKVESNGNQWAYNPKEKATGICQVRPIRLRDYEIQMGIHYELKEMYDTLKAKEVFMYYATKYRPENIEAISRSWNGGYNWQKKKSTINYYLKIKKAML